MLYTRMIVLTIVLLFVSSCGQTSTLCPVQGKVMHNGVPAEGALVVFHPASPTATILPSAAVASDGSFSLVSDGQPGAPAGEYTVTIVWEKPGKRKEESTDKLKGKYSAPGTSKLRATIPAPGNQLPPFELN